jgi:hypothetical protein
MSRTVVRSSSNPTSVPKAVSAPRRSLFSSLIYYISYTSIRGQAGSSG